MKKLAVLRSRASGYILMEIMLVVAIIAVITGVSKIQRTEQDINNIYSALKLYEARNYQMPDQGQGLGSRQYADHRNQTGELVKADGQRTNRSLEYTVPIS